MNYTQRDLKRRIQGSRQLIYKSQARHCSGLGLGSGLESVFKVIGAWS